MFNTGFEVFYDSWLIVGGGQLKMDDVINGHSISFDIKL